MIDCVNEEIEWLLGVGFIRPTKYTKSISNVVLMLKKNDKLIVSINLELLIFQL
jgi:hypothetical protein